MDTDRVKKASEWFYRRGFTERAGDESPRIFQDESIPLRKEAPPQKLPPLLRAARALELGSPSLWQSRDSLFIKQAALLASYTDDCPYDRPVLYYFPTYQALTDDELRGYFTWRTRLRRGDIQKTSLTFAFLYIYELLNQIGVSDPLDGYRKLLSFLESYGSLDGAIAPYLNKWLLDYAVYYDLDPALLAELPLVRFDRHLATLANPDHREDSQVMAAITALSGRWLERSKFYGAYREDMDTVTVRVLRRVSAHYAARCRRTMVEQYFGPYEEFPVRLFESAVFHRRVKFDNREYALDPVRTYRCKNGFWTLRAYNVPVAPSRKLGQLVKTIDSVMRQRYGYRHPVKPELTTKWVLKLIEEEIQALRQEKEAAEAKKITIDYSRLAKIRQDAAITQDRLTVEEEAMEEEAAPTPAEPEAQTPSETPLSREEFRLLQSLLYGRDLTWAAENGLMLSVLADGINEKLYDLFSDSVLTVEDRPELIEDYIEDLKEMVHP